MLGQAVETEVEEPTDEGSTAMPYDSKPTYMSVKLSSRVMASAASY